MTDPLREKRDAFVVRQCFIRGMHPYHFRSEEWAEIVGVIMARCRPCYHVRFKDGKEDYWPMDDPANKYEFSPGKIVGAGEKADPPPVFGTVSPGQFLDRSHCDCESCRSKATPAPSVPPPPLYTDLPARLRNLAAAVAKDYHCSPDSEDWYGELRSLARCVEQERASHEEMKRRVREWMQSRTTLDLDKLKAILDGRDSTEK